jgi:TonB-linked SusC/RagA family outer membrane protein
MRNFMSARWLLLGSVLFTLAVPRQAEAQTAVLTGRVTTEFGQPIIGANVYINDLAVSVATNEQGVYNISVPTARVSGQQVNLRVRVFGYQPQVVPVRIAAGTQEFNFAMKQDVNRLAEIVVTGVTAGTEVKRLPFSVARIDEREMPVPSANPLSQLQGKVTGVNIVSGTGRPGAAPAVLLRGPKMINATGRSQEPLYIVDGVAVSAGLADINPQDIESVEVIKGAAASSMYGARAGAGVIQITTKSGREQQNGVRFSARSEYGRSEIESDFRLPNFHHMMMDETGRYFCVRESSSLQGCSSIFDFEAEALRINGDAESQTLTALGFAREAGISSSPSQAVMKQTFQIMSWPRQYNPIRQLITPGQRTNSTFDAIGRFGGTSFFGSLNNYWEEGAMRGLKGYLRNSGRLNLDQQVGDDWTFGMRTFYSGAFFDGRNDDPGGGFFRATRNPVGVDLLRRDARGRLFVRSNPMAQGDQNYNPVYAFAEYGKQEDDAQRFLGSLTARFTPLSWLDFDANFAYDRRSQNSLYVEDRGVRYTSNFSFSNTLGYIEQDVDFDESYNTSINGSASRTFGDLETRFTTRYLYESQRESDIDTDGEDIAAPGLRTLRAARAARQIDSNIESIRSIGFMAGVDATYKGRYIIGALGRRDGSSLFGAENRWANYGRGSFAWRVSDEPFWMFPQINELKLRASHGTAGGRPRFEAQYETYAVSTSGQLSPSTAGNKALRPETVRETEVGADIEIFNRFGVTATYAYSIAEDQILETRPAAITGFQTQWLNAGTLENKTWELSLNIPIIQGRNLNWSGRINYDATRTMITALDVPPFLASSGANGSGFRIQAGLPYATHWGRQFVRSCAQLPAAQAAQCGAGMEYQANDEGWIVWVGAGNHYTEGITKNLWNAQQAAGTGPWNQSLHWGMPILLRDASGTPLLGNLGSALPKYRLGFSNTFNYKRLFAYAQLDGSFGQKIQNQGRQWSLGDFMVREVDQAHKSVGTAKPLGYYWRTPGLGVQGFYDVLGPNNLTVEDASYMKIREVSLSYNIGALRGTGDWTVGLVGRNLMTFTDYTGYDPETGSQGGVGNSRAVSGSDNYTFPNLRQFTFTFGTKF